jgi:hypothetical protein
MSSVLSDHLQANAQNMVGDMTGAVNVARRELAKVDWSTRQPNIVADDWRIYTHRALGYGAVMVDAAAKRIVVSQATLDTLMYASSAMAAFLVDMTRGASGMKFVMFDAGAYADAAKAERDAKGSNVMQTKDPITDLEERVRRLLVQSASVNGSEAGPTAGQMANFYREFAECREAFVLLTDRVERVQSLFALVSAALRGEGDDEQV